jgi:hypothetical protein
VLRARGRSDAVVSLADDLSWGPIASGDVARRAEYFESECPIPGGWDWLAEADAEFWREAAQPADERLIWVTRGSPKELAGYLAYLARCHQIPARLIRPDLHLPPHPLYGPHLSTGELSPEQMADALDHAPRASVADDERLFTRWDELRSEDALLRIATDGDLVSAPVNQFDRLLLDACGEEWERGARVVGDALAASFDERLCLSSDFLFSRLSNLVKSGELEAEGDVQGWTSEPRGAPARVRKPVVS